MLTRQRLLGRASKLALASLAFSVLIEDGGIRRLLDLELPEEQRVEAIAALRAAINGLEAIEAVQKRPPGSRPPNPAASRILRVTPPRAAGDRHAGPRAPHARPAA